jgi:putative transposase
MPRSTFYRHEAQPKCKHTTNRQPPERALSTEEKLAVLAKLHDDKYVDKSPAQIYASLLDCGEYLCSIRTMYRILAANNEVRERRNILRHPAYKKPELLATAPNQVWSWDITKIKGPEKWNYFYLYVILDIYSRYVVGWTIAGRENSQIAKDLIETTCLRQGINRNQLLIHSDRGAAMTSKTVALLLADLGVTKSFNRPHVSNDNPYSESHFKTMKYQPNFPARFGCIEDARSYCRIFFDGYNEEHHHSGIALLTPSTVHYGLDQKCLQRRADVLDTAYAKHPERFVNGFPKTLPLPKEVWINKPKASAAAAEESATINSVIILPGIAELSEL